MRNSRTISAEMLLGARVLVAESQAVIAMDIMQMLREIGCIALGPVLPDEVVEAVRRNRPDATVLGIDPPSDSAVKLVQALQEIGVVVILLTSSSRRQEDPALLKLACLEKPFDSKALCRTLIRSLG